MERTDFYKYLFFLTAIWNWIIALPLLFIYERVLQNFGMIIPNSPLWIQLFAGFVFLFGIGYYIVSRDLNKNHGFVFIGLMTKILVFLYFLYFFILNELHHFIF
ncbi:MAG: hypothetical protein ACTSYB_02500 [Candidatus Helarchaeota archaeon]